MQLYRRSILNGLSTPCTHACSNADMYRCTSIISQLVSPRRGQAPLNLSQPSLHSFLILPSRGAYIYDRLLWFHFYFRCISYDFHMILSDFLLIPCDFPGISYDSKLISWHFHCIPSEAFQTCTLNMHMHCIIRRCRAKIHIIFAFYNIDIL